jgi:hypothetical protein
MARIRTIKPEFWTDEKLSECSLSARLLFVGLISHADDEGRLDYSPTRIRLQIFPCGKVSQNQLIEWLGELNEHSLIRAYRVDSKDYLDIPGFTKHQRINRPTPSRLPAFLKEHSLSIHGALISGMEGKGMEGNGTEGIGGSAEGVEVEQQPRAARSASLATRIPQDFALTEPRSQYAKDQGIDPIRTMEDFRDYWISASGAKARKHDWDATWRMWCRNQAQRARASSAPRKTRFDEIMGMRDASNAK